MRCRNCNNEINPQIPVCPYCGYNNAQPGPQMSPQMNHQGLQMSPQMNHQGPQMPPQGPQMPPQMPPQGPRTNPPAGQPEKDKTKIILICVLVGVILSIAGIVTAILLSRKEPTDDPPSSETTSSSTETTVDTEEKTTVSPGGTTVTVFDYVIGKPEKHAFDEATNKRETWSGYSFEIPSYLGSGLEIGGGYTYYAEKANATNATSVACMTVVVADVNLSGIDFGSEEFRSALCDEMMQTVRGTDPNAIELSHDGVRINGMDGIWIDVKYEMMSIPVVGRVYALADDENNKYIMLMFQESDSAEYTYFWDFEEIVRTVRKEASEKTQEGYQKGATVKLGKYEQDNNTGNGAEDIEWIVLDQKDDEYLLISRNILDSNCYAEFPLAGQAAWRPWETATSREWLNQEFYKNAFNDEEKARIMTVPVTIEPNPNASTTADIWYGKDTKDKVFLLSYKELETYFPSMEDRICQPTEYAGARWNEYMAGIDENEEMIPPEYQVEGRGDGSAGKWWLRSVGSRSDAYAVLIDENGNILENGENGTVKNACNGIRPAIWVNRGDVSQTKKYIALSSELSGYLGTDINEFIQNADVMYNLEYTSGIGYENDDLYVSSNDWNNIATIDIKSKSDYTLCGVAVGMNSSDAEQLIVAAGGTDSGKQLYDGDKAYTFRNGQTITLWYSGGSILKVSMSNPEG